MSEIEPAQHKVVIELPDGEEKEHSLKDMKRKFHPVRSTAKLQGSDSRRKHMTKESRSTNVLKRTIGAITNGPWTGVCRRDVLRDAGFRVEEIPENFKHMQFMGAETSEASIPIEKAVEQRGHVIVTYALNDQPLATDRRYPLRGNRSQQRSYSQRQIAATH